MTRVEAIICSGGGWAGASLYAERWAGVAAGLTAVVLGLAWIASRARLVRPGTVTCVDVAMLRARGLRVLRLPFGRAIVFGSIGPL